MKQKALFLDRDGVINVDSGYVHNSEDVEFVPGIFDIARLATERGYLLIVVTNQSGIGRGKFSEMAVSGSAFPPLFLWLVGNAGEDLAGGFQRAADIYSARAVYRTDMFLAAALPSAILTLGAMIACQIFPVIKTFTGILNDIGS